MTPPLWRFTGGELDLARPRIMGILNVTPDSFSDGGELSDPARAAARARDLVRAGADLLDIGGESTRPGSDPVSPDEEIRRVIPVIRDAAALGIPVSVDTSKAVVAREALEAGAVIINDVTALADPEMSRLAAVSGAGLVLMHMQGEPRTMQSEPRYDDVVAEVAGFLAERRTRATAAGAAGESIVLDPGIGFGKTLEHNLALLAGLNTLLRLGSPILVGASRKRFIGEISGETDPKARIPGSLAAMLAARTRGAAIFRVHDVAAARQALDVFEMINNSDAG